MLLFLDDYWTVYIYVAKDTNHKDVKILNISPYVRIKGIMEIFSAMIVTSYI